MFIIIYYDVTTVLTRDLEKKIRNVMFVKFSLVFQVFATRYDLQTMTYRIN